MSSRSPRRSAIVCGSARSKPIPEVEPPISSAADSARAWSRPVTTTVCPSPAYDCANSRPSPCVPPTTTTVPPAIPAPFGPGPRRTRGPDLTRTTLDGCHRGGRPVGQQLTRAEDVISRLVELAEDVLQLRVDELTISLDGTTGNEDRVDVRRVCEDDDRADRVDHRRRVDRIRLQQDDVGLLARSEGPDL